MSCDYGGMRCRRLYKPFNLGSQIGFSVGHSGCIIPFVIGCGSLFRMFFLYMDIWKTTKQEQGNLFWNLIIFSTFLTKSLCSQNYHGVDWFQLQNYVHIKIKTNWHVMYIF